MKKDVEIYIDVYFKNDKKHKHEFGCTILKDQNKKEIIEFARQQVNRDMKINFWDKLNLGEENKK